MLPVSYSTPPSTPSMSTPTSTPMSTPISTSSPASASTSSLLASSSSCCQVCDSTTASWHYGAIACEACKKFFIRSHVDNRFLNYACVLAHGKCEVTLNTRSTCQYCRWIKCRRVGMYMKTTPVAAAPPPPPPPTTTTTASLNHMMDVLAAFGSSSCDVINNKTPVHIFASSMASMTSEAPISATTAASVTGESIAPTRSQQELSVEWLIKATQCAVCSAKSSGVHFGVITCEACKAFFRRALKGGQHTSYKCMSTINNGTSGGGSCAITTGNRTCRACRFAKCLQVGMASENSKVGRKSNITKQQLYSKRRFEQQRQQKQNEELEEGEVDGGDNTEEEEEEEVEDEFSEDSANKRMRFDVTASKSATYSSAVNMSMSGITGFSSHGNLNTCTDCSVSRLRYQQYFDASNFTNFNPYQMQQQQQQFNFLSSTGQFNNHL